MGPHDGECTCEVAIDRRDGRHVVVFRGELDMASAPDLWAMVEEVRRSGQPIVVDFAETTFMDSSGVNLLMRAHNTCGAGSVTLRAASQPVTTTLVLAGIADLFPLEDEPTAPAG
jgi:stage II sporulation protein AA (anti-sigma F factor antagonist)